MNRILIERNRMIGETRFGLCSDHRLSLRPLESRTDKLDGDLPDHIEEIIEMKQSGSPCSLAFNRRGHTLAAGTTDGSIALIDFDTKNQVMKLQGHRQESAVKGVCWSRDGRTLVSAASDGIVLWDVASGEKKTSLALPHEDVKSFSLSQRSPLRALVSYTSSSHPPTLVNLESLSSQSLSSDTSADAVMSRDGKIIFFSDGNKLSRIDGSSLKILESVLAPGSICKITICQRNLIVCCDDGNIFLYPSTGGLSAAPKGPFFHSIADDSVIKVTSWNDFCLTQDGGYLAAVPDYSSLQRPSGENLVYFWSLASCELERVVEGLDDKEKCNAFAVVAHPMLPVVVTVSDPASSNLIYVWAKIQVENWSAFAPDFEELQENKLYVESEDEFDWNTDGNMSNKIELMEKRKSVLSAEADTLVVDVFTMDKRGAVLPSDDEEDEAALHYLDVVILPDPVPAAEEERPPAQMEEEEDPRAKVLRDIAKAEEEDALVEEEEMNSRKTRSRNNSRVNSRATSPSAADGERDKKRRKA